jgi:galactokinase
LPLRSPSLPESLLSFEQKGADKVVDIEAAFRKLFEGNPCFLVRAPGRVNLIGEHTDYNDGYVLPMAIDKSIVMAVRPRDDNVVRLFSMNFNQSSSFEIGEDIPRSDDAPWSNYVRGVAKMLFASGYRIKGMDAVIYGDIPIGSGLSSSAAMEVCAATAFEISSGLRIEDIELIRLSQRAENEFVGVRCGIMDQFISRLGRRGHALLIDCRTLSHRYIRMPDTGYEVVVFYTGVKRALSSSEYNTRRAQCEEGVSLISGYLPGIKALRDVGLQDFLELKEKLPPLVAMRCEHVIRENERTLKAAEALEMGDIQLFGRLMVESHESLRDLYEVSSRELDLAVELAMGVEGVLGSRMTGAGFGGCTVTIMRSESVEEFMRKVPEEYRRRTGIEPAVYPFKPEDGARVEKLS